MVARFDILNLSLLDVASTKDWVTLGAFVLKGNRDNPIILDE